MSYVHSTSLCQSHDVQFSLCCSVYNQTAACLSQKLGIKGQTASQCLHRRAFSLKRLQLKLLVKLTRALSNLAFTYNTFESSVTKTQDWLKSTINTQNFQIHVLERQWWLQWLSYCLSFYCFLESLLFALEKVGILFCSQIYFPIYISNRNSVRIIYKNIENNAIHCSHQPHLLRTCHRNATLSNLVVMHKKRAL